MKLQGKTVLITGGTSGIGLELARQLLQRGNTVAVTGRDRSKLERAKQELPLLHVFENDVAEPAAGAAFCQQVLTALPALDVLVNNAGIMRNLNLREPRDPSDLTREIDVLLRGTIHMTQHFLPHLCAREEALVVNVTSALAFVPLAMTPVYSAAKAGLHAYTQCLRVQLKSTPVSVVELAPPATDTSLLSEEFKENMRGQKVMEVVELVKQAVVGIEAGKVEIRPGLSNVLKTMSRIAPGFIFNRLNPSS